MRYVQLIENKLEVKYNEKRQVASIVRSTYLHDMYKNADEKFYQAQYWKWINDFLVTFQPQNNGIYYDLGCGQGRFSLSLAKWCNAFQGSVIGVDISSHAIKQANSNAKAQGCPNIKFSCSDLDSYIENNIALVEGIVFLEVAFFFPNYINFLKEAVKNLQPGGFLIASFRSSYFNALSIAGEKQFSAVNMLLSERSGRVLGGGTHLNWSTSSEIKKFIEDDLGLKLHELVGIGSCSGIAGDPHANQVRPSKLDDYEKKQLMELELEFGKQLPDSGRYMLAIATKE